jgi:hypothetical protein
VSIKVDPEEGAQIMRDAGLSPLVPYPGSGVPWPCIHDRCGREIAPNYANVRMRGRACKQCAADDRGAKRRAGVADAAIGTMRSAGFEPLEEYPGSDKPWRSRHESCGEVLTPTLNTVNANGTACRGCSARAAGRAVWTPALAEETFRERGLEPLEPWPGSSSKPWRARHLACGRTVSPRLGNVAAGQGPCRECGQEASHRAMLNDSDEAVAFFQARGLEPLELYAGVDHPWRSRHERCGRETSPTFSNIKAGGRGCSACFRLDLAEQLRMPETKARAIMLEKGLDPVKPYPGSGKPWQARHVACGRVVSPTLSNVKSGKGICRYCNSDFPFDGPASLYLVADKRAVKIGIASPHLRRLADHRRFGWSLAWVVDVNSGDDAYALEQAIITWWRDELSEQPAYEARELPQTGFSESASWDKTPPVRVLAKLEELAADLGIALSGSYEGAAFVQRPSTAAHAVGARVRAAQRRADGLASDSQPWQIPSCR